LHSGRVLRICRRGTRCAGDLKALYPVGAATRLRWVRGLSMRFAAAGLQVRHHIHHSLRVTKMKSVIIASILIVAQLCASAGAETLHVPSQYHTIQSAIEASTDGDTIIVSPGLYCENVKFKGKNVTLRSINPSSPTIVSQTVISAGGTVVALKSDGEISGFTIRNSSEEWTDGIDCSRFSPTISHCVIKVPRKGIKGCVPYEKPASRPLIKNNIINSREGVYLFSQAFAHGGVNAVIRNNIIISDGYDDGVGILYRAHKSLPLVTGNIITGCDVGICFIYDTKEDKRKRLIRYNDIWGNRVNYASQGKKFDLTGVQGNISADPLFLDSHDLDFHLQPDSPCVNAGNPNFIPEVNATDIDGQPRLANGCVDIGVDEIPDENLIPVSLSIVGPSEMGVNSSQQFTAIANTGNWMVDVTRQAEWAVHPHTHATIDSGGLLSIGDVKKDLQITVYAQLESPFPLSGDKSVEVFRPQTVHVPSDYGTIQDAIDAARNGDTVVVADGTYFGEGNYNLDFKGKNLCVRSANGPNRCAIDCQQSGRGFYFHRGENSSSVICGFTVKNGHATNGGAIYSHSCSPQIVDCNIVSGSAVNYGGAVYIYSGSPLISECTIRHNVVDGPDEKLYGGAIFCEYADLTIRDSVISENSIIGGEISTYWGNRIYGAAVSAVHSKADLNSCVISKNVAKGRMASKSNVHGGAVHLQWSSAFSQITDCVISENEAIASRRAEGGGIYWFDGENPLVSDCIIQHNVATGEGVVGGGVFIRYAFPVHIYNCDVSNNIVCATEGAYGAGLYLPGDANLSNTEVAGNMAIGDNRYAKGGGIFLEGGRRSSTFVNCEITGNLVTGNGGAIFLNSGLRFFDANLITLQGCTVTDNVASQHGGAIYYQPDHPGYSIVTLLNSVLWGNIAEKGLDIYVRRPWHAHDPSATDSIKIRYSDVCQSELNVYVENPKYVKVEWGEGNTDAEPCFVERGYWGDVNDTNVMVEPNDANAVWVDGDYRLRGESACIDAGDPNYEAGPDERDLDGLPRISGGRIDMGAYEYTPPIPAQIKITPRTLNQQSGGRWVMCTIRLPSEYDAGEVDGESILMNDELSPQAVEIFEQRDAVIAVFSREAVAELLEPGENEVFVTGRLEDGRPFEGTEVVTLVNPGGGGYQKVKGKK